MVFQWFFYMWTIGVDGFSMVFFHVNHWYQWFLNGFFTCEPLVSMVFQWFFLHVNHWCQWFFNGFSDLNHWYQWFFQWFFTIEPLPLNEWFVAHHWHRWFINGFGESERWFTKEGQNAKKHNLLKKKHRDKQTLDRLTWSNVTKVSLVNHFSSLLALWLPPVQH